MWDFISPPPIDVESDDWGADDWEFADSGQHNSTDSAPVDGLDTLPQASNPYDSLLVEWRLSHHLYELPDYPITKETQTQIDSQIITYLYPFFEQLAPKILLDIQQGKLSPYERDRTTGILRKLTKEEAYDKVVRFDKDRFDKEEKYDFGEVEGFESDGEGDEWGWGASDSIRVTNELEEKQEGSLSDSILWVDPGPYCNVFHILQRRSRGEKGFVLSDNWDLLLIWTYPNIPNREVFLIKGKDLAGYKILLQDSVFNLAAYIQEKAIFKISPVNIDPYPYYIRYDLTNDTEVFRTVEESLFYKEILLEGRWRQLRKNDSFRNPEDWINTYFFPDIDQTLFDISLIYDIDEPPKKCKDGKNASAQFLKIRCEDQNQLRLASKWSSFACPADTVALDHYGGDKLFGMEPWYVGSPYSLFSKDGWIFQLEEDYIKASYFFDPERRVFIGYPFY